MFSNNGAEVSGIGPISNPFWQQHRRSHKKEVSSMSYKIHSREQFHIKAKPMCLSRCSREALAGRRIFVYGLQIIPKPGMPIRAP